MEKNEKQTSVNSLIKLISILSSSPWVEIIAEGWKFGKKVLRGLTNEGMYEMLDYETTLEILDKDGKRAKLDKRMKVKYLQDNIIAFQDYAWSSGKGLINYRATPGKPVDKYESGYKTHILLSLREIRNKGDIDDFNISWELKDSFLKKPGFGFWETQVSSRIRRLKVNIILPKQSPAHNIQLIESHRRRTRMLSEGNHKQLPDGRWKISWETSKPTLFEGYIIKWDWVS